MGLWDIFKARKVTRGLIEQSMDSIKGYKLTRMLIDQTWVNNEYGKFYEMETTIAFQRLKIAADKNQIELMLKLGEHLKPPFFILYVLVTQRNGHPQGRYQSNVIVNMEEVGRFLHQYKDYFETDGRHHVWIGTADNSGLLIYDQHNVIYAYGQLDEQIETLKALGFQEKAFSFPVPHAHRFDPVNDQFEDQIFRHWNWSFFPLTEHDTYDE